MLLLIKTCMNNAIYNSNTCIDYELSFFRNTFYLDKTCSLTRAITIIWYIHLDVNEQVIGNTLIALIHVRVGLLFIDHFDYEYIVNTINGLSIALLN